MRTALLELVERLRDRRGVRNRVLVRDVLDKPRDRCGVLHALARWEDLSRADYAAAGGGLCRDYAFEAYPWTDVAATTE